MFAVWQMVSITNIFSVDEVDFVDNSRPWKRFKKFKNGDFDGDKTLSLRLSEITSSTTLFF